MRFLFLISLLISILGCETKERKQVKTNAQKKENQKNAGSKEIDSLFPILPVGPKPAPPLGPLELKLIEAGLVNVQDSIPQIFVDLKYSSTDNFIGLDVYENLNSAYLQPDVCSKLKKALLFLQKQDSSLSFLIYDAVRPRSVQQLMWDTLKMPIEKKVKFVSNPANGSLHNYGAAVDITLCDSTGSPLDMGAGFDDTRLIAWPVHEQKYLESGELNQKQVDNRILLRKAMRAGGFFNIQSEWWHFNSCYRAEAQTKYKIIE